MTWTKILYKMSLTTTLIVMTNKTFINYSNYDNGDFHGFRKKFPLLSEAIRYAINEGKTKFNFSEPFNRLRDALSSSYILDDELTDEEAIKFGNVIWFNEIR